MNVCAQMSQMQKNFASENKTELDRIQGEGDAEMNDVKVIYRVEFNLIDRNRKIEKFEHKIKSER